MATRADIQRLALTDPFVRAHVDAQRFGRSGTWEEMMCSLVVTLVEAKDAAQALAIDYAKRLPLPAPPNYKSVSKWNITPLSNPGRTSRAADAFSDESTAYVARAA